MAVGREGESGFHGPWPAPFAVAGLVVIVEREGLARLAVEGVGHLLVPVGVASEV